MDSAFTCGRCRIWTGDRSKSIADIFASEEEDLAVLDGCIQVVLVRGSMRRGVSFVSSSSRRAVFIAEDSIRLMGVYCPSPFSMTVVMQVDVSDTNPQYCFMMDHVTNTTEETQHEFHTTHLLKSSQFLSALHGHLREVPLTTAARDVLAKKRLQDAAIASNNKPAILKRRRTISSSDFYGRATNFESLKSSPLDDSASWKSFYERLQFNVSQSLLCQLEGTSPLSSSFPRQQEAFEFADQVIAFRERLARRHAVEDAGSGKIDALDQPRVFCFEGANEGKRRFWVTTLRAFWKEYVAVPEGSRHVYEIIREGTPCRLYFDLEFNKKLNHNVDGEVLVSRLISLLQLQIYRQYHLLIDRGKHVVELESSTQDKFSRHLTVSARH